MRKLCQCSSGKAVESVLPFQHYGCVSMYSISLSDLPRPWILRAQGRSTDKSFRPRVSKLATSLQFSTDPLIRPTLQTGSSKADRGTHHDTRATDGNR